MNKRNTRLVSAAVVSAALLTGCGGGGGDGGSAADNSTPGVGQNVTAVVNYINNLISSTPESGDPVDVNLLTLAEDDAAEPAAIN